jgi:hypothetical protein
MGPASMALFSGTALSEPLTTETDVVSRTFFAYHLTHHFGPFSQNGYHTNSTDAREGDLVYVVSGDDARDGGKDYALEGLFRIQRRQDGPFDLRNVKGQPASFRFRLAMTALRVPDSPIPLARAEWYDRSEVHRYFSSGQNFNPCRLHPTTRSASTRCWPATGSRRRPNSPRTWPTSNAGCRTPRSAKPWCRPASGRGDFGGDVTRLWGKGEVCALTGIALPELLVASHVKPWRDATDKERLDPANGLLLAVHADKLFDRHLLSFDLQRGELRSVIASIAPRWVRRAWACTPA